MTLGNLAWADGNNDLFWRYLYLRSFDALEHQPPSWHPLVQQTIRARQAVKARAGEAADLQVIGDLLLASTPPTRQHKESKNVDFVRSLLPDLDAHCPTDRLFWLHPLQIPSAEARATAHRLYKDQQSARISVLLGFTERAGNQPRPRWTPADRLAAKSYVYFLPRYTAANNWGPFISYGQEEMDLRGQYTDYQCVSSHVGLNSIELSPAVWSRRL
jgi:hypothetical protein